METLAKTLIILLWLIYRIFTFAFFLKVPQLNEFSNNKKQLTEAILVFSLNSISIVSFYFFSWYGLFIPFGLFFGIVSYGLILTLKNIKE